MAELKKQAPAAAKPEPKKEDVKMVKAEPKKEVSPADRKSTRLNSSHM